MTTNDSDQANVGRGRLPCRPPSDAHAIITAVLPLLAARGTAVTSRELSEAAGVAEGTIFKAFTDKDDLFRAALDRVVDPEPTERAIRSIDPALPYEQRVLAAAEHVQRRHRRHLEHPVEARCGGHPRRAPHPARQRRHRRAVRLRTRPAAHQSEDAARRFRALIIAFSQPMLYDPSPSAAELVEFFLHGVSRTGA